MKANVVFLLFFIQVFDQTNIKQNISKELTSQNVEGNYIGNNGIEVVYLKRRNLLILRVFCIGCNRPLKNIIKKDDKYYETFFAFNSIFFLADKM
jgi:hypothetical protein